VAAAAPRREGLRSLPFHNGGPAISATVTDDGHRGLLVRVGGREQVRPAVQTIRDATEALGAEIFSFHEDGSAARGLHIWCARDDLLEAFVGFCEPFVLRIRNGEPVASAFTICFDEFRRLVGGLDPHRLPGHVVGALGELLILRELVEIDLRAAFSWAFPKLERHDFRMGNAALEVKTTLRSNRSQPVVTISSFDQLDPPLSGTLHLHWLQLERDPAGPISILALLDSMASILELDVAMDLRKRVLEDAGLQTYSRQSFSVHQRRAYRVGDLFPALIAQRLIRRALDQGIGKVSYELDLSAAESCRCLPAEANQTFMDAAGPI
jgi:hypothetical protein